MDARDLMALVGLLLLAGGGYLVYPPLALLLPGLILTHKAIYGHSQQS